MSLVGLTRSSLCLLLPGAGAGAGGAAIITPRVLQLVEANLRDISPASSPSLLALPVECAGASHHLATAAARRLFQGQAQKLFCALSSLPSYRPDSHCGGSQYHYDDGRHVVCRSRRDSDRHNRWSHLCKSIGLTLLCHAVFMHAPDSPSTLTRMSSVPLPLISAETATTRFFAMDTGFLDSHETLSPKIESNGVNCR